MACRLVLTQGMKQALAAWKVGEEPVGAKRNKRACAEAGRAGAVPPAHASLKLDEFCPHPNAGTFASHLTPSSLSLGHQGRRGKDTVSSRALAITRFSIICRCRDRVCKGRRR